MSRKKLPPKKQRGTSTPNPPLNPCDRANRCVLSQQCQNFDACYAEAVADAEVENS